MQPFAKALKDIRIILNFQRNGLIIIIMQNPANYYNTFIIIYITIYNNISPNILHIIFTLIFILNSSELFAAK